MLNYKLLPHKAKNNKRLLVRVPPFGYEANILQQFDLHIIFLIGRPLKSILSRSTACLITPGVFFIKLYQKTRYSNTMFVKMLGYRRRQ